MRSYQNGRRWWGTWMVAGLAVGSLAMASCADHTKTTTGETTKRFQLTPAADCDDVEDQIVDALVEQALNDRYNNYRGGIDFQNNTNNSSQNNTAEPTDPGENDGPDDFTTTNVQEEGVDEADFMKTDGKFVYVLRGQELVILKSWPAEDTEIVGRIALPGGYPSAMFLKGDRVALFSNVYVYACDDRRLNNFPENNGIDPLPVEDCVEDGDGFSGTRITVVDVTNRTSPTILRSLDVESQYNNARMIGSDVYMVSNSYSVTPNGYWDLVWGENTNLPTVTWESTEEEVELARDQARPIMRQLVAGLVANEGVQDFLPRKRVVNSDGTVASEGNLYACTDVYLPAQPTTLGMLNITHFKIDNDSSDMSSTGLLAGGWTVYGSQQNLYVAMSSRAWWWGWGSADNSSHIHKFALDGPNNKARYAASGEVDGWLLNQFSMSEYEGHLRVATTDNEWIWDDQSQTGIETGGNHVIVLKEETGELVETGSIRNLATGEQVFSARFLGNKGYVVTFRQTDPLFTFDLTDPTNPVLKGELKINGFSSYIHPMGPNHLLTIGQDATDEGVVLGVHLQIFDVTDLNAPTRTYQHKLSTGPWSSWSEAMWDHHAFTYHLGKEVLAIPFNSWDEGTGEDPFSGLVVLKASNTTGFEELGRVQHGDLVTPECTDCGWGYHWWVNIRRSIFMEDYLFSISDVGVKVNDLLDPSVEHAAVTF